MQALGDDELQLTYCDIDKKHRPPPRAAGFASIHFNVFRFRFFLFQRLQSTVAHIQCKSYTTYLRLMMKLIPKIMFTQFWFFIMPCQC